MAISIIFFLNMFMYVSSVVHRALQDEVAALLFFIAIRFLIATANDKYISVHVSVCTMCIAHSKSTQSQNCNRPEIVMGIGDNIWLLWFILPHFCRSPLFFYASTESIVQFFFCC